MDTQTELPSGRRVELGRLIALLLRPRQALVEITAEARSQWMTPMLILSITALLSVAVRGYLKSRAALMGEVQLPTDWQYWTPEMQNNYMQAQQATQGPVFTYVIPLVGALAGLWIGWLLLAGLLHLASTLLGGRGSIQHALNVVAWAGLPFAVRDLLRVVFMLLAGRVIVSPGLSGFVDTAGFLTALLARVDLFLIWNMILLVIGFRLADGLSRGRAVAGVVTVLLIALAAQAGLGTLGLSLGGAVIQRPFF